MKLKACKIYCNLADGAAQRKDKFICKSNVMY
jgi:hypothetical protein